MVHIIFRKSLLFSDDFTLRLLIEGGGRIDTAVAHYLLILIGQVFVRIDFSTTAEVGSRHFLNVHVHVVSFRHNLRMLVHEFVYSQAHVVAVTVRLHLDLQLRLRAAVIPEIILT